MFIQSTHCLEFTRITEGENQVFTSKGKGVKEEAPDWIVDDDYFVANEAEGKITNLSKSLGSTQESQPEDIVIDGVSIYSYQFPAVNYLPGVSPELFGVIRLALAEGRLTDIADRDKVTLIGDKYVRNAVLQEIASGAELPQAEATLPDTEPKPRRGGKKAASEAAVQAKDPEPEPVPGETAETETTETESPNEATDGTTPQGF